MKSRDIKELERGKRESKKAWKRRIADDLLIREGEREGNRGKHERE